MTSEGSHHPGQQPDEVSPGAGGPAPYGDRTAHQDNGYGAAAPDLGWAPPPPTARPNPPAPAWAAQSDQPSTAPWGATQVPQQQAEPAQPGHWGAPDGSAQPAWATQHEQPGPAWAAAPAPMEQSQPAWAQSEQQPPAWQAEPGARGAAQVPQPAGQPHDAWGAQDDPARSGGWNTQQEDDSARSGGWNTAAPSHEDDPARSGGWATTPAPQQAEPASPAWAQAAPGARGAAQVPQPAGQPHDAWAPQDDPARSGGWNTAAQQEDEAAHSGGWSTGAASQEDDPARPGGWSTGASSHQEERPQQAWGAQDDQPPADWAARGDHQANGWGSASVPQQRDQGQDWPAQDEPARAGAWGAAAGTQQDDRPEATSWATPQPPPAPPARATATVAGNDGPPAWGAAGDNPPQWPGADRSERPAVPNAEPWGADEAWGRNDAEPAQAADGWEPHHAEEQPVYQPAPAPGISPANAVPLPPQEQRVPGASLAAAPPADYAPPAQYTPGGLHPTAEPSGASQGYEPEQPGAAAGWGTAEEPQSPAGPMVPAPRTSPESDGAGRASVPAPEAAEPTSGAGGAVSASASVPLASRVMPPTDQALRPGATPAPQPRVYGRPARPEPAGEPEQAEQHGYQPEQGPPQHGYQPEQRFDDHDRPSGGPTGFAEAPSSAPPAFPPGVPSFVDPPSNNRPMNGVRPHTGAERPADPFGPPPTPAGAGGPPSGGVPGYGHPAHDPAHGGFPPPFPSGQQPGPSWQQGPGVEPDQGRFDAFKPDAEPKAEQPTPKIRNGRVLAAVLVTAVLILAVPLGLLTLIGTIGGADKPAAFDPAVGSCVKQSNGSAVAADCGEGDAFSVVSKVDAKDKCADPAQPHVVLPGDGANRVLCLKPATAK